MNDPWLDFIIRIQAIAQAGLAYGKDRYDLERYTQLRQIAAEMLAARTSLPKERIGDLFLNESGYQTPKVDTRGAVFLDGKILLARENNGAWALPGGWCDVDLSVAANTEKEVLEETGAVVRAERLIAVQDWRRRNVVNHLYGVVKVFMLCRYLGGTFEKNIETTEAAFFAKDALPSPLAEEKTTREQIDMCFAFHDRPDAPALFD